MKLKEDEYSEAFQSVVFTRLDVYKNDGVNFENLPVYKFYPANNKIPIEFQDSFTENNLIDFIRKIQDK